VAGVLVAQPYSFTVHNDYYPFTPSLAHAFIQQVAEEYKVDANKLEKTLKCESTLRPNAIGDNGHSLGIAQINMPSHPDVTPQEAFNPYWAIEWTAKEFSNGYARHWTCARHLGFVTDG
jgi:hypothetical protein